MIMSYVTVRAYQRFMGKRKICIRIYLGSNFAPYPDMLSTNGTAKNGEPQKHRILQYLYRYRYSTSLYLYMAHGTVYPSVDRFVPSKSVSFFFTYQIITKFDRKMYHKYVKFHKTRQRSLNRYAEQKSNNAQTDLAK